MTKRGSDDYRRGALYIALVALALAAILCWVLWGLLSGPGGTW